MNLKRTYLMVVIISLVVIMLILPFVYRSDIHNATYTELCDIQGIGEVKASLILSYLKLNKDADTNDLEQINGIGDTLVKRLKKDYR